MTENTERYPDEYPSICHICLDDLYLCNCLMDDYDEVDDLEAVVQMPLFAE